MRTSPLGLRASFGEATKASAKGLQLRVARVAPVRGGLAPAHLSMKAQTPRSPAEAWALNLTLYGFKTRKYIRTKHQKKNKKKKLKP